ncbi:MAG: DNA primase [Candidatus Paceibacteria bacterium]|jgi:DNA primase
MIDPKEQIKDRLSIVDVVSSYISVFPAGKNHKAVCPFHNEKTPSFHVSPDRGSYYCFGCGAKGDIFSFVQEFEGLDFRGALNVLAQRAGVTLTQYTGEKKETMDHLFKIMEQATLFFEKTYQETQSAKDYMKSRGVEESTAKDFRVGYAPNDWRVLFDHLTSLGVDKKDQILVGLIKEGNGSTYDRFRDRVVFPIFDTSGRPIAFSGRAMGEDEKAAKYLNSPETPLFQKSDILYGLHVAKDSIRKMGFSVLVEGQLDLLLSHQAGFSNTVASSGTALTDKISKGDTLNHFGIIKRLSNNVVLAFDSDAAGLKAMYRAARICLSLGMESKTAKLPEGKDPADIISLDGVETWKNVLQKSEHSILFLTKYIVEKEKDVRFVGKKIQDKILPLVGLLESSMERASFVREISGITNINEESIQSDLKKTIAGFTLKEEKIETREKASVRSVDKDAQIKKMVAGMFALLVEREVKNLPKEVENEFIQDIINSFDQIKKNALMFEIEEVYKDDEKKLLSDFTLYVKEAENSSNKNRLADLEKKIKEGAGDEVFKQYQEILRNINNN